MGFKLCTVGFQLKVEFLWIFRCRFKGFIDKPFFSFFKACQVFRFLDDDYRKSRRTDTEMRQILRSNTEI